MSEPEGSGAASGSELSKPEGTIGWQTSGGVFRGREDPAGIIWLDPVVMDHCVKDLPLQFERELRFNLPFVMRLKRHPESSSTPSGSFVPTLKQITATCAAEAAERVLHFTDSVPPVPSPKEVPPVPSPKEAPPVPSPKEAPPVPSPKEAPPVPSSKEVPPVPRPKVFAPLPPKPKAKGSPTLPGFAAPALVHHKAEIVDPARSPFRPESVIDISGQGSSQFPNDGGDAADAGGGGDAADAGGGGGPPGPRPSRCSDDELQQRGPHQPMVPPPPRLTEKQQVKPVSLMDQLQQLEEGNVKESLLGRLQKLQDEEKQRQQQQLEDAAASDSDKQLYNIMNQDTPELAHPPAPAAGESAPGDATQIAEILHKMELLRDIGTAQVTLDETALDQTALALMGRGPDSADVHEQYGDDKPGPDSAGPEQPEQSNKPEQANNPEQPEQALSARLQGYAPPEQPEQPARCKNRLQCSSKWASPAKTEEAHAEAGVPNVYPEANPQSGDCQGGEPAVGRSPGDGSFAKELGKQITASLASRRPFRSPRRNGNPVDFGFARCDAPKHSGHDPFLQFAHHERNSPQPKRLPAKSKASWQGSKRPLTDPAQVYTSSGWVQVKRSLTEKPDPFGGL